MPTLKYKEYKLVADSRIGQKPPLPTTELKPAVFVPCEKNFNGSIV